LQLASKTVIGTHTRYFSVRNSAEAFRGCLDVSRDATEIRDMKREKRLLE
jgi:DUF438 domain-containing protein